MFGRCHLGDKTTTHRNFGKIRVWPRPNCHTSQAFAGRSAQSCHSEPRSSPSEGRQSGNIHGNGKQTLDAMGRLGKIRAPAMAPALINFIFGDGDIFDMSHSFLPQSSFASSCSKLIFNENLCFSSERHFCCRCWHRYDAKTRSG
jgi:hypothetical protein